jgi:prepilin-type N-terminal cleavage/methylation domain-containing protein
MTRPRPASPGRPGFSLIELIVVVTLIGLMALMAVPTLQTLVPSSRLNSESRRLAAFLRQARFKAANTQKSVRVSINCMSHFATPARPSCRALMETAMYSEGEFHSWRPVRDGRLSLYNGVNLKSADAGWDPTAGSLINDDLIWLIFTPSSRVLTSFGPPVNLAMWYGDGPLDGTVYEMSLNTATGRVSLDKSEH